MFLQGAGMYSKSVKQTEEDIQTILKRVNELSGIKESDTGLAPPALWDLAADKQTLQSTCMLRRIHYFSICLSNVTHTMDISAISNY